MNYLFTHTVDEMFWACLVQRHPLHVALAPIHPRKNNIIIVQNTSFITTLTRGQLPDLQKLERGHHTWLLSFLDHLHKH